jgi:hypothetical protein
LEIATALAGSRSCGRNCHRLGGISLRRENLEIFNIMPPLLRHILFFTFLALFLIITPLLILYANGYQFSLMKKNFVKTGMLILDTRPRGASIYIDSMQQNESAIFGSRNPIVTPAKIKGLLPGDFSVRLVLEGYWPWEKKLSVQPGASTYAEDVLLFKKSIPVLVSPAEKNTIIYSPDTSRAIFKQADSYAVAELSQTLSTAIKLDQRATSSLNAVWSPTAAHLLIGRSLFDMTQDPPRINPDFSLPAATAFMKWDEKDDNAIYYFDEKNQLIAYDLSTDELTATAVTLDPKLAKNDYDFEVRNDNLYFVKSGDDKAIFNVIAIPTGKMIKSLELPASGRFRLINPGHNYVNLFDDKNKALIIIDPLSNVADLVDNLENITVAKWINDDKLLYANDYEIWIYDLRARQKRLLTRISDKINDVFWHPSNNYVIYSTDGSIVVIELDEREKNIRTELFSGPVSSIELEEAGKTLYFYTTIGNIGGLYELDI